MWHLDTGMAKCKAELRRETYYTYCNCNDASCMHAFPNIYVSTKWARIVYLPFLFALILTLRSKDGTKPHFQIIVSDAKEKVRGIKERRN